MANKRMISSSTWSDEKFITLNDVTRLVWFGIITNCDDQGRLQDNPLLIKAQIFPADRKSAALINDSIDCLVANGMVTRYTKDGKALLQINNWWTHQSPAWAAASDYPPPDNWIDRVKIHAKGGTIQSLNWDQPGGYIEAMLELHSGYIAATQPIEKIKVKDEVKDEVKSEDEQTKSTAAVGELARVFELEIGELTPVIREELEQAAETYPPEWIIDAIREAVKSNARKWKYVLAILKRWQVEGRGENRPGNGKARVEAGGADLEKYRKLYKEQKGNGA